MRFCVRHTKFLLARQQADGVESRKELSAMSFQP